MYSAFFVQGSIKEMLNLSQQDYVKRIEELNQVRLPVKLYCF